MENFSVLQPDLLPYSLLGPDVVPVGTGMGDSRIPGSLCNQGGPIKSSQDTKSENTINRTKSKSIVLTILSQSYHRISFPMLSPIKYGPFSYAFNFNFFIIYFHFINGFNFKMSDAYV
jgi:hypothetical protein